MKKYKTNIINFKELRENAEVYIREVQKGKSFLVMRRSTPIFIMSPVDVELDVGKGKKVVDFTPIKKRGVPIEEIFEMLREMDGPKPKKFKKDRK